MSTTVPTPHSTATANTEKPRICAGLDLGGNLWALSLRLPNGKDSYHHCRDPKAGTVPAGRRSDLPKEEQVYQILREYQDKGFEIDVVYEAGRWGFTPALEMQKQGLHPHVVSPNRLQVIYGNQRAKTDRLDAKALSYLDVHHPKFQSVHIPSLQEQQGRDLLAHGRQLAEAKKKCNNQITSLLARWPAYRATGSNHRSSARWDEDLTLLSEDQLPVWERERVMDFVAQLELVERQIGRHEERKVAFTDARRKAAAEAGEVTVEDQLRQLVSIGEVISTTFSWRIGEWTRFGNGKQFSNYFGLTPVPQVSCTKRTDRGISKQGASCLRHLALELAHLWVRHQSDSELVRRWSDRLNAKGKTKRIALVGLARQLMVALWRYIVKDEPIAGARMRSA